MTTRLRPTAAPVCATLLMLVAALIGREFVRARLIDSGYGAVLAKDLSYLAVPLFLGLLMWPLLRRHAQHLRHIFRLEALTPRVVICGILVGVLFRVAWWSHLVAGISFGLIGDPGAAAGIGPVFQFDCPPYGAVLPGLLATAVCAPFVEETVHRGLLLSGLLHRGRLFAIVASTLIFMISHNSSAYAPALFFGLVLALQYCATGAVWFSLATHASYNALIQLDWYCLNGQWIPAAEQLPLYRVGLGATTALLLSAILVRHLIRVATGGTPRASRL